MYRKIRAARAVGLVLAATLASCAYRDQIIAAAIGTADAIGCNVVVPVLVTTPEGQAIAATACDGRAAALLTDVAIKVANDLAKRKGGPVLLAARPPSTWAPLACRGLNIGSTRAELRAEMQSELDQRAECTR